MVSTATGERGLGVCSLGCPGLSTVSATQGLRPEKHPILGTTGQFVPMVCFSVGLSLLRRAGGRIALRLDGTFVYLRLYCVCIPGAFRAWHQHPTPPGQQKSIHPNHARTSWLMGVQPGDLILVMLRSKSFRTSSLLPDPIPSVTAQGDHKPSNRGWTCLEGLEERRFGHRLVGGQISLACVSDS